MMPNLPIPPDVFSLPYLVDKVAIAILLLIVGMAVTLFLQRDQARVAYNNELEKQRVLNLSEVWTALYEFKSRSDELLEEASEAVRSEQLEASEDRLRELETRSRESAERLKDLAGKYQFWLSDSEYSDVRELNNLLMERMGAFANGDSEGMPRLTQGIEDRLPTIDKYLTSR